MTVALFFVDIWLQCFIFSLISSLFVHIIASAVAFGRLRKHQWGRFLPILIIVMGIISPLTFGVLTSRYIKWFLKLMSQDVKYIKRKHHSWVLFESQLEVIIDMFIESSYMPDVARQHWGPNVLANVAWWVGAWWVELLVCLASLDLCWWTLPCFVGAAIAGIYVAADFKMASIYAVVWGCAQTVVLVFVSYTRFLFTLWPM